jgi:hypothetical protein
MMTIVGALFGLVLPLAAPEPYRAPPSDNANNNSVNRALSRPPSEEAQFARVPGGTATPRSEWKTGDKRGQPPEPRRKRRNRKQKTAPRKTP